MSDAAGRFSDHDVLAAEWQPDMARRLKRTAGVNQDAELVEQEAGEFLVRHTDPADVEEKERRALGYHVRDTRHAVQPGQHEVTTPFIADRGFPHPFLRALERRLSRCL